MPELEGDDWWRRGKAFDEDDNGSDDWESDDEDDSVIRCRFCKEEIIDNDIVQCPYCGKYLSHEGNQPSQHASWVIWTAIVCIFATLCGWLFFLR